MANLDPIGYKILADFSELDKKFNEAQKRLNMLRRDAERPIKIRVDNSSIMANGGSRVGSGNGTGGSSINAGGFSPNTGGMSGYSSGGAANAFAAGAFSAMANGPMQVQGHVAGGSACATCGHVSRAGSLFCTKCGSRLRNSWVRRPNLAGDVGAGVADVAKMGFAGARLGARAGIGVIRGINRWLNAGPAPITAEDIYSASKATGIGVQEGNIINERGFGGIRSGIADIQKDMSFWGAAQFQSAWPRQQSKRRRRRKPRSGGAGGFGDLSNFGYEIRDIELEGVQSFAGVSPARGGGGSELQPSSYASTATAPRTSITASRSLVVQAKKFHEENAGLLIEAAQIEVQAAIAQAVKARPGARVLGGGSKPFINVVGPESSTLSRSRILDRLEGVAASGGGSTEAMNAAIRARYPRSGGYFRLPSWDEITGPFKNMSGVNVPGMGFLDQPGSYARALGVPRWATKMGGAFTALQLGAHGLNRIGQSVTGFMDNRSAAAYMQMGGSGYAMGMNAQDFYNAQFGSGGALNNTGNFLVNEPTGIGNAFFQGLAGVTGTTGRINRQQTLARMQQSKLDLVFGSRMNRINQNTQTALDLNTDQFKAIDINTRGLQDSLRLEQQIKIKEQTDSGNLKEAARVRSDYESRIASAGIAGARQAGEAGRSYMAGLDAIRLGSTDQIGAGIANINASHDLTTPQGRMQAGVEIAALKASTGIQTHAMTNRNKSTAFAAGGFVYAAGLQDVQNAVDEQLMQYQGSDSESVNRRNAIIQGGNYAKAGINRQYGIDTTTDNANWFTRRNIATATQGSLYDIRRSGEASQIGMIGQHQMEMMQYINSGRMTPTGFMNMMATHGAEFQSLVAGNQKQINEGVAGYNMQLESIQNATAAQNLANTHKPASAQGLSIMNNAMSRYKNYQPSGMGNDYDTKMKKAILEEAISQEGGVLAAFDYHMGSTTQLGAMVSPKSMMNPYAEQYGDIWKNIQDNIAKMTDTLGRK